MIFAARLTTRSVLGALMGLARRAREDAVARGVVLFGTIGAATLCSVYVTAFMLAPDGDVARAFDVSRDRSIPEFYAYALSALCLVGFARAWRRTKLLAYAVCSAAFAFVLADDALQIHEVVGKTLDDAFALPTIGTLREQDTGELLVWSLAGLAVAAGFAASLVRGAAPTIRVATAFAVCASGLLVFGIAVDMISIASSSRKMGLIEDAGEMVALSLAAGIATALARSPFEASEPIPALFERGLLRPMGERGDPLRRPVGQPRLHAVAQRQDPPAEGLLPGDARP